MTPRRDGGANRIEEGARESRRSKLEFPTPSIDLSVHGYLVRFLSGLCLDRLSPASPHHQTMLPSQPRRRRRYELWLTCNGKGESGLKQIGVGADGDKGKEREATIFTGTLHGQFVLLSRHGVGDEIARSF